MIEQGFVEWAKTVALIREIVKDRIFPGAAPQGTKTPFAVVSTLTNPRRKVLSGRTNLSRAEIVVEVASYEYRDCKRFADAMSDLFTDGFRGMMGGFTVDWVWFQDETDQYSFTSQGTDVNLNIAEIQLAIWYRE